MKLESLPKWAQHSIKHLNERVKINGDNYQAERTAHSAARRLLRAALAEGVSEDLKARIEAHMQGHETYVTTQPIEKMG